MSDGTGGADEGEQGDGTGQPRQDGQHTGGQGQPGQGQAPDGQGHGGAGQGQSPGGRGGQPGAGGGQGQAAGGPGQAAGGQAAGGQSQAGAAQQQPVGGGNQPAGGQGQPAGGYQQPQGAHVQTESVTDVLSKPNTQSLIRTALVFYAAVGAGIGLSLVVTATTFGGSGFGGSMISAIIAFAGFVSALAIGPALGGPLGFHVVQRLRGEESDEQILATAGVGAFGGHVAMVVIVAVFIAIGAGGGGSGGSGFNVGTALIPIVVGGFGAAIAAVGTAFATLNFTGTAGQSGVPQGPQR